MPQLRSGSGSSIVLGLLCAVLAAPLALAACSHDWDLYDPRGGVAASGSGGAGPGTGGAGPGTGGAGPGTGGAGPVTGSTGAGTGGAGTGGAGGSVSIDGGPGDMHVTSGLIALYTFEEGQGSIVHDVSNVVPALDLTIAQPGAVTWAPGMLSVNATTLIQSSGPAKKVIARCKLTNEITLDVWLKPSVTPQTGPARIITSSVDTGNRNFQLGHDDLSFEVRLRVSSVALNGEPFLEGSANLAQVELTHIVFTREASGVRRMFVNGTEKVTDTVSGNFADWSDTYPLLMADELTGGRSWLGELHRAAIYERALSTAEVAQNYEAGP